MRQLKSTPISFSFFAFENALTAAAAVDTRVIARRASAPAAISVLLDQERDQAIAAALR